MEIIDDAPIGGFWGLVLQPGKSYSQAVDATFRISMAALGMNLPEGASRTSVTVTVEEKQFVLCSLIPEKIEQTPLDHIFNEGENISFSAYGNCPVHLTGYYLPEEDDHDHDHDEYDSDELDDLYGEDEDFDEDEDDEDEDEDEDEEEGARITELGSDEDEDEDEEVAPQQNGSAKRKAIDAPAPNAKKQAVESLNNKPQAKKTDGQKPQQQQQKPKQEQQQQKPNQQQQQQQKGDGKKQEGKPQQQQQKQQQQKPKQEQPKKAEAAEKGDKKTLGNGLIIEDTKVGQGKTAKKGNTVFVRYTGRLASNNSVFDSNTSGAPFKFRLGGNEVIKGWDLGLEGMVVGGERKLVIPAPLAYGAQGAPPSIPKNAKLIFDVKLLDVK